MIDSSSHGSNAADNSLEQESLTQIEGIGKVKKQWLESIGVDTLQALAEANADEIVAQLSDAGHTAHASEVERWITQAQELIAESSAVESEASEPLSSEETETVSTDGEMDDENQEESSEILAPEVADTDAAEQEPAAVSEAQDDANDEPLSAAAQADWQTFAVFTVEFQSQRADDDIRYRTRVRQLDTDRQEVWPGIEERNLQLWLRSRVADGMTSDASMVETTDDSPQITPAFENLFILQPPSTATAMELYQPNMMFPSPIRGNLPFSLVLQFSIYEQDRLATVNQGVSYKLECYVRSLKGGEAISLGELPSTVLLPQDEPYMAYLPAISLQKGIYRLQVFLSLEGIQALPTFLEVPVVQVV
ncbi:MAG: DUF4332 domain-containing protein [Leptolyngbyaceae cyanobacterium]